MLSKNFDVSIGMAMFDTALLYASSLDIAFIPSRLRAIDGRKRWELSRPP
jgi:hypothetical protein